MTGGWIQGDYKVNDYRNNISTASRYGYEVDFNSWSGGQMFYDIANTWTEGVTFSTSDADFALTDSTLARNQLTAA